MLKTLALVNVIVFGVFSALGYLSAARAQIPPQPSPVSRVITTPGADQNDLLLIQIDRLDASKPMLRAVWMAGIFRSANQTVLTFFPLFPVKSISPAPTDLSGLFALNPDGSLGKAFVQAVAARGVQVSAFLLIDDEGYAALDQFLRGQDVTIFTPAPSSPSVFLLAACQYIHRGSDPSPNSPGLDSAYMGKHLRGSLSFDQLLSAWNGLAGHQNPPGCDVIE